MKIFHLPDLGEGLAEAEIREWYVKAGDEVKVDQPLVSMETAKAVVDVPSPYAGVITTLHGNVNDVIPTGAPLISFQSDEKPAADQGSVVGKLETSENAWSDGEVIVGAAKPKDTKSPKAMPAARVLAQQMQVELAEVTPSGPQGLITVDDVKKVLNKKNASSIHSSTTPSFNGEALHGVRRSMAIAMAQSHQQIVPVTLFEDVDITHLPPKTDMSLILLKALAHAVKAEPALNAWFNGQTLERKIFTDINVGLAVDSAEGLFVPVIKNIGSMTDESIRQQIDQYKASVADRSVAAKDMQDATITLSNFGTITGRYATPIIVPPAVAILGCGRSRKAAVIKDDKLVVGKLLPLSLTFDHRAVTGGEATRFLGAFIEFIKSV